MITESPSLGIAPTEAALLVWADNHERRRITVDDAAALFGRPRSYRVLSSLTRKGLLTRVGQGVYLTRPLGALGRRRAPTGLAMVALLFGANVYYVGGRSAASLHHLTTQRFLGLLDVYTDTRVHVRRLGAARLVLHPLPRAGAEQGIVTTQAQDIAVRVSDPERTVIDLIDRLDRLLGWEETQQLALDALVDHQVDVERLIRYAAAWPKHTTAARLGVLLARAGITDERLAPLVATLAGSAAQTALVPGKPRRGPWDPRFRVILNDRPTHCAPASMAGG